MHDTGDPRVLAWAPVFRQLPLAERAAAILRFCQKCIRYTRDPGIIDPDGSRHGIEVLKLDAVGLDRGYGDCNLKARLFVALCLLSGLDAVIEPVFSGENGFPHVRARVHTPGSETSGTGIRACGPRGSRTVRPRHRRPDNRQLDHRTPARAPAHKVIRCPSRRPSLARPRERRSPADVDAGGGAEDVARLGARGPLRKARALTRPTVRRATARPARASPPPAWGPGPGGSHSPLLSRRAVRRRRRRRASPWWRALDETGSGGAR